MLIVGGAAAGGGGAAAAAPPPPPPPIIIIIIIIIIGSMPELLLLLARSLIEFVTWVSIAVISELPPLLREVTRAAPPATLFRSSVEIEANGSFFDMGIFLGCGEWRRT